MISKKYARFLWLAAAITVIGGLVLAGLPDSAVQAGAGLPPRATPVPPPPAGDDDKDSTPVGAYIELQVSGAPAGAWGMVQWQDSAGNWHDVEGWQGTLDEQGTRRWWVAAKDFGSGPFRWVVQTGPTGSILTASEPFYLPTFPNETLQVFVK